MSDKAAAKTDLDQLIALNRDYINSVQTMDCGASTRSQRGFRVLQPRRAVVDRAAFLAQTARPITISAWKPATSTCG